MSITVYDYAEHVGEALAWTSPSKGCSPGKMSTGQRGDPLGGQLLYSHLKQAAMFGGDSNSRWCAPPPHGCGRLTVRPKEGLAPQGMIGGDRTCRPSVEQRQQQRDLAAQTTLFHAGLTGCIGCPTRW